jgi:hypothetical protein
MHLGKIYSITAAAGFALAASVSLSLASCRGLDQTFSCEVQAERFEAVVSEEGEILPALAEVGIFPMAMMVSEQGVNDLLNGVVGKKVPFASTLSIGPLKIEFEPSSEPVIDIASVPGCAQCVLISLEFEFAVGQGEDGVGAGIGAASLSIPVKMEREADGTGVLIASYEQATVASMDVNVSGFDSQDHEAIAGALALLATDTIREQYGPTELLRIGTFSLGSEDVLVATTKMFVVPQFNALLFGMETNLALPPGTGLDQPQGLPADAKMGLLFDPGLLQALSQRMLVEGKIARRYDDEGEPDPEGKYGVTISGMKSSTIASNRLDTYFRVWRTDGDYCGFAEVEMPLFVSLATVDSQPELKVDAGSPRVIGGEGSGKIAANNAELVQKNEKLIDNFKASLAEQVLLTINYDEIGVEGSTILFKPIATEVNSVADSVNVLLDFTVIASE